MKMSKVGNQTNSQDPQAVNSRVFVGNLNTFQCSKTDVERMFQRYGRLAGISMHKGYAFVQFTNPFDARSACLGEDGRTILSQVLDVNMVAEPKPHQTGRKRQNVNATGNDWDYYYDSYYASAALPSLVPIPRTGPPAKRPRLMPTIARTIKPSHSPTNVEKTVESSTNGDHFKKYSNPDILICGNCRELFTEIHELLEHKKTYCKLRFTCKCRPTPVNGFCDNYKPTADTTDYPTYATLLCVQCKESFPSAWDLMVHVQAAHSVNIYTVRASSSSPSPQDPDAAAAADLPLPLEQSPPPPPPDSDKEGDSNSRQSSINDNGNEDMLVFQLLPNSQLKFKNIPDKAGIMYEGITK